MLTGSAVLAVWLLGCEKPGVCGSKDLRVEVGGNHGHAERIERAALEKGAGNYRIGGDSHEHGFRLQAADVERLKAGDSVDVRSTSMNGHVHPLRLSCER